MAEFYLCRPENLFLIKRENDGGVLICAAANNLMPWPLPSDHTASPHPPVGGVPVIMFVTLFWLVFACLSPSYQLREARRQARQDLLHAFAPEKPDTDGLIAAFGRSNQKLDAAASGPCLLLALTSILLVQQTEEQSARDSPSVHRSSHPHLKNKSLLDEH